MNAKLTLTIDPEIIIKAKGYASHKGRSLSELVENYFKSLVQDAPSTAKEELTPSVKSLMGSIKTPKKFDYDYKKILKEQKAKRHG